RSATEDRSKQLGPSAHSSPASGSPYLHVRALAADRGIQAVSRGHPRVVGKLEQAIDAPHDLPEGSPISSVAGTAGEQRVAGEEVAADQIGHAARRMAGRVQRDDLD